MATLDSEPVTRRDRITKVALKKTSVTEAIDINGRTQREDLPEQDAVGPHVALVGVDVVKDALWGHPLDGQPGLRAHRGEC